MGFPITDQSAAKPPQADAIIVRDAEATAAKQTLMKRLKTNSILSSVSRISTFIAGPLFAVGILEVAKAAFGGATIAVGLASVSTAAVGILAIGAAFVAIAVVTDYMALRKGQSNALDSQEVTAQSNARNLVRELEAHNLCLTNKDNVVCEPPQRRDGKTWTQAVAEQQAQQAAR